MAQLIKVRYISWNGLNQNPGDILLNNKKITSKDPLDDGTIQVEFNNAGYDPQNISDVFIATSVQSDASVNELQYYTINVYKDDGYMPFSVNQVRNINSEQIVRISSYGEGSLVIYQEFNNLANNFITAYCTETFNSFISTQSNSGVPQLPTPIPPNKVLGTDSDGNLVWIDNGGGTVNYNELFISASGETTPDSPADSDFRVILLSGSKDAQCQWYSEDVNDWVDGTFFSKPF